MKNPKKKISLVVAILLSVAAGLAVLFALYRLYLPTPILLASKDIPAGKVISADDIAYGKVSARDRHPLACVSPDQVIGKYAKDNLYAGEPILAPQVVSDQTIQSSVAVDETVMVLKQSEARWPPTVKEGQEVTIVAVPAQGTPRIVGQNIRVLSLNIAKLQGTIDQLKSAGTTPADNTLTLAAKWKQVGPILDGKANSKELWVLPETNDKVSDTVIFAQPEQGQAQTAPAPAKTAPAKIAPAKTAPAKR